jgi:WD40 repeat protein
VQVWDTMTGECTLSIPNAHDSSITSLVNLPGEDRLVSCSWDCSLRVFDLTSGEKLETLVGHDRTVSTLCLLPDGAVASGAHDKTIRVWNVGYTPPTLVRSALKVG